jgi:hypothetical protein
LDRHDHGSDYIVKTNQPYGGKRMSNTDQSISEFAHLIEINELTVCQTANCYEIRGRGRQKRLAPTRLAISPGMTFSVRSLTTVSFEGRQVVLAILSYTHNGRDLANILAHFIVNPINPG